MRTSRDTKRTRGIAITTAAATLVMAATFAPAAFAQADDEMTLEERVLALERAYASLDTRFNARTSSGIGAESSQSISMERRVTQLENLLNRMTTDVQRLERAAESAMREASQARREAQTAERIARDASMRAR
jgi:hypothetical protein